jgi:dihydrodipicolinate synthase/N-acetylneuraminate lyase
MIEEVFRLKESLSGSVSPAMATPLFPGSARVRLDVIQQLVDFLLERGVRSIFVGGTTGEGVLLDVQERMKLHEAAVAAVNGRALVLLHVGAQRTDAAVELANHAAGLNVDAVVAVTPYFYATHDQALAIYYMAIADAAPKLPLFGYDIPHMAVNGISPSLAGRLCQEIPSMAGFKSSNTSANAVGQLVDAVSDDHIVLAGNESIALGSLALGADGLISGLSTAVPEPFMALTQAFDGGDIDEARGQQRTIKRLLTKIPPGERLGAIKSVLNSRGVPVGPPVPPIPASSPEIWAQMQEILGS